MNDRPAAARLARALRELRERAGSPSYATIATWGRQQKPAVNLGKSKLSPWFKGTTVPTEGRPFNTLVELLEARALHKSAHPKQGLHAWLALREAAHSERRDPVSGRSTPTAQTTTSMSGSAVNRPPAADGPSPSWQLVHHDNGHSRARTKDLEVPPSAVANDGVVGVNPHRARAAASPRIVAELRPISALSDPLELEVHRALQVDRAASADISASALPSYVSRAHDDRLAALVSRATNGRSSFAVLVGDSGTGKTRACWEAIHRPDALADGWRLWHPIDPSRTEALIEGLPQIGPRTVIWLNELQHYLLTDATSGGERAAAGLRTLLRDPDRTPVLVLATLWPAYHHELMSEPIAGSPDCHPQAGALLASADTLHVPSAFSGTSFEAVKAHALEDPQLALALAQSPNGRIGQFLAGAPEQERLYRVAAPAERALLCAAMDARRFGWPLELPLDLLCEAADGYFDDVEWDALDDDWSKRALIHLSRSRRGARGPLSWTRPRPAAGAPVEPMLRLADHLDQLGRTERRALPAPASLWEALHRHALVSHSRISPSERRAMCRSLAAAARQRGLLRHSYLLYEAATRAGDPWSFLDMAVLRRWRECTDEIPGLPEELDIPEDTVAWAVRMLQGHGAPTPDSEALATAVRPATLRLILHSDWRLCHSPHGRPQKVAPTFNEIGLSDSMYAAETQQEYEHVLLQAGQAGDSAYLSVWTQARLLAGDHQGAEQEVRKIINTGGFDLAYPSLAILLAEKDALAENHLQHYGLNADGTPADPW